jgi:hypothetical protein
MVCLMLQVGLVSAGLVATALRACAGGIWNTAQWRRRGAHPVVDICL